jgi:hypothetical protein
MALSVVSDVVSTELLQAVYPDWYIWPSPGGRQFAARRHPLADGTAGPMIISADSGEELAAALALFTEPVVA